MEFYSEAPRRSSRARASRVARLLSRVRTEAPALVFGLAVGLGQGVAWALGVEWASVAMALLGVWLLFKMARGRGSILVGVLVGLVSTMPLLMPRQSLPSSEDAVISGVVQGPIRRSKPGEVSFVLVAMVDNSRVRIRCRAVDLPWRNAARIVDGDRVWVRGALESIERPLNPLEWEAWLWRRGIVAEMKARYISRPATGSESFAELSRRHVVERVRDAVGDTRGAALFLSMALGYRDILSEPVERAFLSLGLTHLLVVSGYQVSMVFGCMAFVFYLVVRRAGLGAISRAAAMTLALSAAGVYVWFIGQEMSAIRALIAAGCVCGQMLTERNSRFAQRWGVALLCMQLLWPTCVWEIGVMLTFAALFGIGLGSSLARQPGLVAYLWVTLSVWLSTSLIVVVWNGALSPMSLVLNLALAPLWSALNCTIGMVGLSLLLLGWEWGGSIVSLVARINEFLAHGVVWLSEGPYVPSPVEGAFRFVIVGVILAAIITLAAIRYRRELPGNPTEVISPIGLGLAGR